MPSALITLVSPCPISLPQLQKKKLSKDISVLSVCKTFPSILPQTQPTHALKLFLSRSQKMCMLLTTMINFQFSSYWMNQTYLTCLLLNKLISLGFHDPHLLGSSYLPNCSFSVSFAAYSSFSLRFTCGGVSQAQSLVFSSPSTQWFLNFDTMGIWGQIILCIVGYKATSLASIHSILSYDNQKCSHTLPTILWGEWGITYGWEPLLWVYRKFSFKYSRFSWSLPLCRI